MKKYLFPKDYNQYKVNLHTHTDVSDGALTPKEVKEKYKALGYSAICFTDHEILISHQDLTDDTFIALNGFEMSIKRDGPYAHTGPIQPCHHLVFIAKSKDTIKTLCFNKDYATPGNTKINWTKAIFDQDDYEREYSLEGLNKAVNEGIKNNFIVHYCHPNWSLQEHENYDSIKNLYGVEVWNTDCRYHGDTNAKPYYHFLNKKAYNMVPVASDDMHTIDALGVGFNMIFASSLTYENLITNLENGNTYASTGVIIEEFYVEDDYIYLTSKNIDYAILKTEGRVIEVIHPINEKLVFKLPKNSIYFRIELYAKDGRLGFTKAYLVKDFI